MKLNSIICGDAIEEMKKMPANSVDTIITDPPYGLEFMGKEWDKFGITEARARRLSTTDKSDYKRGTKGLPEKGRYSIMTVKEKSAFQEWSFRWATEALRVAKPGATLLCFGGTRTYHRLACAIEDAGWILKDCIMWIYGSGFPKASDLSLTFDKQECRKQLTEKLGRKPTKEEFKKEWEGFRKKTGEIKKHAQKGVAIAEERGAIGGGAFGEARTEEIREPATPEAKLWNGWKSHGLKPAYEPIIVAMKPNEGSYSQNALKYGVAGLNIEQARIGTEKWEHKASKTSPYKSERIWDTKGNTPDIDRSGKGRYPSNIVLDYSAAKLLDEMSGECKTGGQLHRKGKGNSWFVGKTQQDTIMNTDRGIGASRFFKVIKLAEI